MTIGIGGAVFLVLLVLKLAHINDDITWFWVWFPLWIGAAVQAVILLIGLIVYLLKPKQDARKTMAARYGASTRARIARDRGR